MEHSLNEYQQEQAAAENQLKQIVNDVLAQAKRLGASSAEVCANKDAGLVVTVRLGETETVEFNRDKGLDITVYFGQSKGSASTNDTQPAAISKTVAAACDIAKATAKDPCAGLADKELIAHDYPDLQLCYPWSLTIEEAIAIAKRCEDAARDTDARIVNSEGATLTSHHGVHVYANSHGFIGSYPLSRHSLSCVLVAKQDGKMQRDYDYTVSRDANKLIAAEKVGHQAAQRTLKRLGGRSVKTCQVPVMYSAEIAGGLLWNFIHAISGGQLYRRASFLLDALNKSVFPSRLHIYEDPHIKGALGSAPFDAEGVATHPRDLIRAGQLVSYILGSYSARKLGMQTTGNAGGAHNILVKTDDIDFNGVLQEMGTGLLVTEVMGHGTNLTTGDYSQGASGFWVEQGQIQYPVEGVTIASNLADMFKQLRAVGNDIDERNTIRTGSILIDGMTVAGA